VSLQLRMASLWEVLLPPEFQLVLQALYPLIGRYQSAEATDASSIVIHLAQDIINLSLYHQILKIPVMCWYF